MTDKQNAIRAIVSESDIERLKPFFADIEQLIDNNPFAERINYLLANPSLATTPVKNKVGESSPPNCLGTAFFVAGVSSFNYPYHAYDFELERHMKQPDLKRQIGAFIFSCSWRGGWHAGIYLGKAGKEPVSFAQQGHGCRFAVETINYHYEHPQYFIPKTLRKKNK